VTAACWLVHVWQGSFDLGRREAALPSRETAVEIASTEDQNGCMLAVISAVIAGAVAIVVAFLSSRWDTRREAERLRHELNSEVAQRGHEIQLEAERRQHALDLQEHRYTSTDGKNTELWGLRDRNDP
jgi:anti-sigma-K factor RskA